MEKFSLSELGKRIKAIRKAKKKTQEEVAAAIGISQKTISEWERGLIHPGILNMHNYCTFLGITLDELLEVKKPRTLLIELTEEERDTMLSMLDECQREAVTNKTLQSKLHFFEQHVTAFFSRAKSK